jgi:two-component system, LytTR family, response regulator
MKPVRLVIVDDEVAARDGLKHLASTDPDLDVVAVCENGTEAIEAVERHAPDSMLLDIQMPGLTGFDVLRAIDVESMPLVVFITAFEDHAVKAFEESALDYLLKPFDDARFQSSMARIKHAVAEKANVQLGQRVMGLLNQLEHSALGSPTGEATRTAGPAKPLAHLVVRHDRRVTLLRTPDIDWIEAADYYARVRSGGRSFLIRETMASLETRLDSTRFFRIHRSAIVNLDRVKEIQTSFKGEHVVILLDGTRLPLNRNRRALLEKFLDQKL